MSPSSAAAITMPTTLETRLYDELHQMARRCFRSQRGDHTLQPTALVHEAWMKLSRSAPDRFTDRHHFLATAATAMRQVLINHARGRDAARRGGGWTRRSLEGVDRGDPVDAAVLIDLADALDALEKVDPRKASVAELRMLGGMTHSEIAERLGCGLTTVEDDWRMARAWIASRLEREPGP